MPPFSIIAHAPTVAHLGGRDFRRELGRAAAVQLRGSQQRSEDALRILAQLRGRAELNGHAVGQHQDGIAVHDGVQPMRDDERRGAVLGVCLNAETKLWRLVGSVRRENRAH